MEFPFYDEPNTATIICRHIINEMCIRDRSMIGQIEEQQTLMAEMILEMQNRDTQLSLMPVSYTHLAYQLA